MTHNPSVAPLRLITPPLERGDHLFSPVVCRAMRAMNQIALARGEFLVFTGCAVADAAQPFDVGFCSESGVMAALLALGLEGRG